ncbi:MAG: hypothetical protein J6D29_00875 [Solobacterium sp.]|nr:hypothetical protein [Solobacterium sp.]
MRFKKQRNILVCGILCLVLLLTGCAQTKISEEAKEAEISQEALVKDFVESLSLKEQLEQMMMVAIRPSEADIETWNQDEITKEFISTHSVGGVIAFLENIHTKQQTYDWTCLLKENTRQDIPLWIGIDQEGGIVTRLPFGTETNGNMALAATGNPDNAKKIGTLIGEELAALGFNVNFAPVVDVNRNPANPVIGIRAYSDDADVVSSYAKAYIDGLTSASILSCIKHFPGHGDTDTDSHTGLPLLSYTKEELKESDLIPFQTLIQNDVPMIMTAHIQYPNIETSTYQSKLDEKEIYLPATLSKTILTDILRKECGFEGVIVSDSFLMDAIAKHFDLVDASVLAINAGLDLILMPINIHDEASIEDFDAYIEELIQKVEEGVLSKERIIESVCRMILLKQEMNLSNEIKEADLSIVGGERHLALQHEIGKEAITCIKNDAVFPLTEDIQNILFAAPYSSQANSFTYGIKQYGNREAIVVNYDYGNAVEELYQKIADVDLIVIASDFRNFSNLDRSTYPRIDAVLTTIEKAHELDKKVVVMSIGIPYDVALFEEADALLLAYCDSGLTLDEKGEVIGSYGPNLLAAMDLIFQEGEFKGSLPVSIPGVEDGMIKDTILYPRGYQSKGE